MRPIIFTIFDGLGDRPIEALDWQTPLEAANTPNLDKLAELGITGLIHTVARGTRPGSDVAHLSLFGYDPHQFYTGRGAFEAAGYGIELKGGDVALRGNTATVDADMVITDRRAGRLDSCAPLAEMLDGMQIEDVNVIAKPGLNYRMMLVLRGPGLSDQVSDIDPHEVGLQPLVCEALDDSSEAEKTARIINELVERAHKLFAESDFNKQRIAADQLPANVLLTRGAGKVPDLPSFEERYRMRAACIAGAGLYKGVTRLMGMDIIEVEGATGKPASNIENKIKKAIEILPDYNFIFIHIKATDSLAEDGKALEKRDFLTKVDPYFAQLIPMVEKREIVLSITGDHSTSSELQIHTADEVPLLVAGFGVRTDHVKEFGERPVMTGGIGHMQGRNLIDYLINLVGGSELYGN